MRTESINKPRKRMDYGEVARASVRRQMGTAKQEPPRAANIKQVIFVGENSCYYKQRNFFLGKWVRIKSESKFGGFFVEFCREEDREALNLSEGWKYKNEYLLDCAKFR